MNEINSINDLVNILNDLGAVDAQKTRLFRGQADQAWDLLPGIYCRAFIGKISLI